MEEKREVVLAQPNSKGGRRKSRGWERLFLREECTTNHGSTREVQDGGTKGEGG
jgi:hypothetical protein